MPTIPEIRAKFPQYNDMSDADLAEGLHSKYYADMPFGEFAGKIGFKREWSGMPGEMKQSAGGNAVDIAQGLGHAVMNPNETIKNVGGLVSGGIDNLIGMGLDAAGIDRGTSSPQAVDRRAMASGVGHQIADTLGTKEGFKHYVARSPVSAGLDLASLLTGGASQLSKVGKVGEIAGVPLKQALKTAPSAEEIANLTRQKFDAIKAKNVQLPTEAFLPARDELGRFLKGEGITAMDAPQATNQFNRLNEILPPHKQPTPSGNWYDNPPAPVADTRTIPLNELESVRRGAGRVERANNLSDTAATDKMVAGKIKTAIDKVYANAADPAIKGEIESAREMGRRNILARQIKEMVRKGEEYRSGAESGIGNQFNSYLKSEKGKGLTAEEKAAFRKVSRREGLAGLLTTAGGGLGKIVLASGGAMYGGIPGALGGVAMHGTARKIMEALTRKAADKATRTVLIGPHAQKAGTLAAKKLRNQRLINALMGIEAEQKLVGGPR